MNPISWVEVPVLDMSRAIRFYNRVFDWELQEVRIAPSLAMAWFPSDGQQNGAGGALVQNTNYSPGSTGAVIYFTCDDVSTAMGKVTSAGGEVLRAKTPVSPEFGFMGLALDSEGNRIALHSKK